MNNPTVECTVRKIVMPGIVYRMKASGFSITSFDFWVYLIARSFLPISLYARPRLSYVAGEIGFFSRPSWKTITASSNSACTSARYPVGEGAPTH